MMANPGKLFKGIGSLLRRGVDKGREVEEQAIRKSKEMYNSPAAEKTREHMMEEVDTLRMRAANYLKPDQKVIDEKARRLYDHYYGTIEAINRTQDLSNRVRVNNPSGEAIDGQMFDRYYEILQRDNEELRKLGLPPADELSTAEYRRLFGGDGSPPELGKLSVGAAGAGALGGAAVSSDADAAGLPQALKLAKNKYRQLADQLAQFDDAMGSSIPQRRLVKRMDEVTEEIKHIEEQIKNAAPAPWGETNSTRQIQGMMDRYPRNDPMQLNPRQEQDVLDNIKLDMDRRYNQAYPQGENWD